MLPRDLLRSLGGGTGRCREELAERMESFSIGGGGVGEVGDSSAIPSGNRGSSGSTIWALKILSYYQEVFL